ncbi:serum response factor-binding protein 1-like [Puntigrus tetrazona]|uniref:serum response factor-binding protein 1-like n=1 Tax=Puntigrus tetrazona TaxID=1606681 RepID=UPI001C8A37B1|nr:serum response factor-binding protein 1-like [Puntigrus tetrazona]
MRIATRMRDCQFLPCTRHKEINKNSLREALPFLFWTPGDATTSYALRYVPEARWRHPEQTTLLSDFRLYFVKFFRKYMKMPAVLILSNEVVKMRVEVKRVKVLLIRKLIRQILVLEKKKGSEAVLEKFRRRAARLREEIHELKTISLDRVTKAALQKDISFEKVCRDKEASLSERAIARIATHPQFSKKIRSIKAAIKAFKEERTNPLNAEKQSKTVVENATSLDQSQRDNDGDDSCSEKLSDEGDDEELKKDEGDKKTDEDRPEVIDGFTEESQKTSVETINEQTNQCQKKESLTVEGSSETVGIPEEVIRMRKEVKRARVLIISKMTEQVASLKKKKKGQESELKESQEKAAEIMKKITALRSLKLDQVTMTALQDNVDLAKVLQDSQASPVDRAIAHIATHSRFINKLQKVKEAIKKERAKAVEAEQKKTDKLDTVQSQNEDEESEEEDEESEEEPEEDEESEEEPEEDEESEEEDEEPNEDNGDYSKEEGDVVEEKLNSSNPGTHTSSVAEPTESTPSKIITTSPERSKGVEVKSQKAEATARNIKSSPEMSSNVSKKNLGKASKETEAALKPPKKKDLPETKRVEAEKDKEESDLSDEEEEKEYFDDSTEERFHKQSSQSEESDDDDFFLGKVSKFKKRKSSQSKVEEKKSELQKTDKEAVSKPHETNLGKLQSVFCPVLSKSSVSSQKAKFGSRPPRFQNRRKGPEGRMKASQYKGQDLGADRRTAPFKPNRETFKAAEQKQAGPSGAERGRPQFEQKRSPRGPPGRMSDPPQQCLHPSWEASRKRKEQQSQIAVFQGKKIKFDED